MRIVLASLVIVMFAGCLSDGETQSESGFELDGFPFTAYDSRGFPVPVPLCFETTHNGTIPATGEFVPGVGVAGAYCNMNMTPDDGRQGNEVTIAVNPTNPQNIVGGAKDYYPPDAGECVWDGVYVTHDGGRSMYEDRSFEGSPWRLAAGDLANFQPNYASQFWCTTDPVAYFDVNGNLYYLLMAYQADRITGSKTCEEICPNGALNDWAFNRATQIIAVSDDGGDSFHTFTPVLEGTYPVNFHDKGWIAASKDGTIHVMWLAFFVPGNQYCRSTDGGQTYLCDEVIATQFLEAGQGSFLEVGTDQQVYAAWYNSGIRLARSFDGGDTWDEGRVVVDAERTGMPGLSARDRRNVSPMMATDRNPDSPFGDAIYFVWQAPGVNESNSRIMFSSSFDEGETFTQPLQISSVSKGDYEIFPAVSVSPGGVIDVSWMDTNGTRNVGHETFEQKYAYSLDGGQNWSIELSIRDANDHGWDPALSHHQNGMVFIGDYNDIDSSWQAAHPVWPDTRDNESVKVFTATLQRPMFAEGWSDEGKVAALQWMAANPL